MGGTRVIRRVKVIADADHLRTVKSKDRKNKVVIYPAKGYTCEKASLDDAMKFVLGIESDEWGITYSLRWCLFPENVQVKWMTRGRPKAGEFRRLSACERSFANLSLTMRSSISWRISSPPRFWSRTSSTSQAERRANIRDGASSKYILDLYLDQYKQEHIFRLLKGKVGFNDVFFKKPERENVMMFVLGMATLIRNVIDLRLLMRPDVSSPVRTWWTAGRHPISLLSTESWSSTAGLLQRRDDGCHGKIGSR